MSGIPPNFYLKKITKAQLLKLRINKYYPEKGKTAITSKQVNKINWQYY